MQTLDAPVYEVNQDSQWYKDKIAEIEARKQFFDKLEDKFGIRKGFGYYHSEFFGLHEGTEAFEKFKGELLKNPHKNTDLYPFKKRSKYFNEIKEMLDGVERANPFYPHDVFGSNNVNASQWIGDRWFYEVKHPEYIKNHVEITPIDYKDYLKIVMNHLDKDERW